MKRYLICSDIHGNIDNFKIALKEAFLDPIDGVLIAGDTEIDSDKLAELVYAESSSQGIRTDIHIVKGNCDYLNARGLKDVTSFKLSDKITCLLTHGHRYQVKSNLELLKIVGDNLGADIIIYGHTHKYDDCMIGKTRFINPGALCGGYYSEPSYILMTVDGAFVEVLKRTICKNN